MATLMGLAKLDRKLARLPDAAREEIKSALAAAADDVVRLAQSLVPVDSGALRQSIGWTWGAPPRGALTLGKVGAAALGKSLTITVYAGNDAVYYARWVEFGTAPHINRGRFPGTKHPGTAAQPFFFPAYRASRKSAKSRVRKAVRAAAKKVAAQ